VYQDEIGGIAGTGEARGEGFVETESVPGKPLAGSILAIRSFP
jgi:hypothetical protein